jgi:antitoxin MazE
VLSTATFAPDQIEHMFDLYSHRVLLTRHLPAMYIRCMHIEHAYPLPPGTRAKEGDFVKLAADTFERLVFQDTRVFKAGNSLAIRIPSAIAKTIQLEDGSPVQMALSDGIIWIRKGPSRKLQDLIERITSDNVHHEHFSEFGKNETW